jgi:hypothetical protein
VSVVDVTPVCGNQLNLVQFEIEESKRNGFYGSMPSEWFVTLWLS